MRSATILFSILLLSVVLFGQADFGDAPDGTVWSGMVASYPSLINSNGPRHTLGSSSTYWIGQTGTGPENTTTLEDDALVVDQDLDDGQPFITVILYGIPATTWVTVPITTSISHNPQKDIYINVLIDVDNDLDFDGTRDQNWVVRNEKVRVPADTTLAFQYGPFGFGSDLLLFPVWLRVTVTDDPISGTWIGQGPVVEDGETEDWYYPFRRGDDSQDNNEGGNGNGDNGNGNGGGKPGGKSEKCVQVRGPSKVYVKCEQRVKFCFIIRNCGSDTIKNPSLTFKFEDGTPPTLGPSPAGPQGGTIPPGESVTFCFTATGWPCEHGDEGKRYALYTRILIYDPEELYIIRESGFSLLSAEDPSLLTNDGWKIKLSAEPVNDTLDAVPWIGKIDSLLIKNLVAWTGYGWAGRWITGNPVMVVEYLPDWATFHKDSMNTDSVFYTFSGTPGLYDNGPDSAVFVVQSDDPTNDTFVLPWRFVAPIFIKNINNPPRFISTFPDTISIDINNNETINQTLVATDADVNMGKRDTIFIRCYFVDGEGLSQPAFTDSGNGSAYFFWAPAVSDTGQYKLIALCQDYYMDIDTSVSIVNVTTKTGIPSKERYLVRFMLYQNSPNPFNAVTTIQYELPMAEYVTLKVYNTSGQLVETLVEEEKDSGFYSLIWDASAISSGVYFIRYDAGNYSTVNKCLLLK
jgi:hypothetical protein